MRILTPALLTVLALAAPATAVGQSVSFTRALEVGTAAVLDIETDSGAIEVIAGEPGRVLVEGKVTVRYSWNVPADAERIARAVAAAPPVSQDGSIVRLRTPMDGAARRAVAVSYRVRVPRGTTVLAVSQSGATTIHGVGGVVEVRTGSATVDVEDATNVILSTGSGAVTVGRVSASTRIETRSSGIRVADVAGPLDAVTQSGRVEVRGTPGPWTISTGSSSVLLATDRGDLDLDLRSRSGTIRLEGAEASGEVRKQRIAGQIGDGGETIKVTTGSGAIQLEVK